MVLTPQMRMKPRTRTVQISLAVEAQEVVPMEAGAADRGIEVETSLLSH